MIDRQFEVVSRFVSYQFGSLWWARDELIHDLQPQFNEREDRIGHPLVSVKRNALRDRTDSVPMLAGTSGNRLRDAIKKHCVVVRGLSGDDPEHATYFGSIIEPGFYGFDVLLDGVRHKPHAFRRPAKQDRDAPVVASEPVPWHELRVMQPNPRVDETERSALDGFCIQHGF